MAYTVQVRKTYEKKELLEGKWLATIKIADIKDQKAEWVDEEIKSLGITPQTINLLLETDTGESGWDTIWQSLDKETFTMSFTQWKMDMYSDAVGIPINTHFGSIGDWLEYIKGKRVSIQVEKNANGYPKIKSVGIVEEGVNF